ncbi:hypothetical protein [Prosthecobacter fusiformis]|nr:hypothetical protein [Prosthecobacter fusiformis]
MKRPLLLVALLGILAPAHAEVEVDIDAFGQSLGGWLARKGKAAEYELSEAGYRTYQPEVSPSPDGGIFVSVRIDHRRGFFASDDHASLELSFAPDGDLVSAQSSLALQGRTISSELIKGGASASTSVAAPQIERAVKVGTDLVADLSSKLLREKIVEPGRVSFPAAIRHNYNLLYKAVKMKKAETPATPGTASTPQAPADTAPPATPPASTPAEKPPGPSAATPPPTAPAPSAPGAPAQPAAPTPSAPAPAPTTPAPPSTSAPAGNTQASLTTAGKKSIPLPEIRAYNPSGVPSTPLPAQKSSEKPKEKSLLMEHGDEVLKLARDVVKTSVQ